MKEPNKDSKEVCKDCKGTGVIFYEKLNRIYFTWFPRIKFSWHSRDKEPCKCTIKGKL